MTSNLASPPPTAPTVELQARRADWTRRVTALVDQVAQWSRDAGWTVKVGQRSLHEQLLGTYAVPEARISLPPGDRPDRAVLVTPVALHVVGGNGRVDVEGYPTLSRVKLIGAADEWVVMTDSNVPLRQPWNADTFRQLAQDLVA